MNSKKNGQSLIEVVVALAVVLLVILALVQAVIVSIKSSDFAKKKAQAANYAREGMENMRVYRDASWTTFWAASDGQNRGLSGSVPSGSCPASPNLGSYFIRCVKLEQSGVNQVKATVIVSWSDSNGTHQSELISYFTNWK